MRRWFITIFTLHFFLSVGFFAFGQVDTYVPSHDQAIAALVGDAHHPIQKNDLLGAAPDHGLTDSQPDLPEFITPVIRPALTVLAQLAPDDVRWVRLLPPTLEGLQRPPRV